MDDGERRAWTRNSSWARPIGAYAARALDPAARARGFATTALVQAPFYMDAPAAAPTTPMIISVIGSAMMAVLAAAMIFRTPPRQP